MRLNGQELIIFDVDGTLTPINEPDQAGKGVIATLAALHNAGVMLALCTSKAGYLLEERFTRARINLGLFAFKVTCCPKDNSGVASAMLEIALIDSGATKETTIYVGDTEIDCRLARACGLKFIAVLSGETEREYFLRIGLQTENILPSVNHLPRLLGIGVI